MVPAPSAAVSGLAPASSTPTLDAAMAPPKASACARERRPDGSGRPAVRRMRASRSASQTWFSAPAEAAASDVPTTAAPRETQEAGAPAIR
jgi:hypothetical protein